MTFHHDPNIPHIIKYMGSKRQILDFVISGIRYCYQPGGTICDLFSGSSVVAGSLRNSVPVIANDIQQYSAILSNVYLTNIEWGQYPTSREIVAQAEAIVSEFKGKYPTFAFDYGEPLSLNEFVALEGAQKDLINREFAASDYHLFAKHYSGTYWSFEQCLWIDALRAIADQHLGTPLFHVILASLMFAMSYTSQSTGHYAQYRDATSASSMEDIIIYRKKRIAPYFARKFDDLQQNLGPIRLSHSIHSLDYLDCLQIIPPQTTVYADPPYCFVHYSRFYHAIETLVLYDYPVVGHKGRYRNDRHQSPFCIRTKVAPAFRNMFVLCREQRANLVLSYSNTGMISLSDLMDLVSDIFGSEYTIEAKSQDHLHSTMGRREDKNRDVEEALIMIKTRQETRKLISIT